MKILIIPYEKTGYRIIGAISKDLGHLGPKHHATILGKSALNGQVYISEFCQDGHHISTLSSFMERYAANGPIHYRGFKNPIKNLLTARRALKNLNKKCQPYNLLFNNCEHSANRDMYGRPYIVIRLITQY